MANRSFEMYEYRRVLVLMRQGVSDRCISRGCLMGRERAMEVRWSRALWAGFSALSRCQRRLSWRVCSAVHHGCRRCWQHLESDPPNSQKVTHPQPRHPVVSSLT